MIAYHPALWLGLLLGLAPAAHAQYRPPPMTEAQRLASAADQPRVEGSRMLSSGDRKGAEAQFKKALGLYEQALKADPLLVSAAEGLGTVGNALGAYDQVIGHLQPVSVARPEVMEVAFNLGVAYFKSKRYEQALPLLEKVRLGNDRAHLVAHFYLAQYHLATGRGDLAEPALLSYLALRPDSVSSNDHEIHALLGRAYLLLRRPPEARAAFERAQQGRAETHSLQIGLANVLELEGKRGQAILRLEGLTQRFPKSAEALERLSRLWLEDGKPERAEKVAVQLIAQAPSAPAHLLLCEVYLSQRRFPEAEAQAQKALTAVPGLLLAQVRLGSALQAQGKHDQAVKVLEQAVQQSGGKDFEALAALGSANRRAGRFQKALEVHQRALQLAPRYPTPHLLLAADYFAAGDWDRAIHHYDTVLQLVPGDKTATRWLALSYARRGKTRTQDPNRIEDGVRDLRRAFDLDGSGVLARNLGAALLDLGRWEEAAAALASGLGRADANWQNSFLLGHAHLGARRGTEAQQAFRASLETAPNDDVRAEISAGLALAQALDGELDAAVAQLEKTRGVKRAEELTDANLPQLLLRRALSRLERGEVSGAREDLARAEKLGGEHPDRAALANLTRALLEAEEGQDAAAAARLKAAKLAKVDFLHPGAATALEGYLHYRAGRFPQARKVATAASRGGGPSGRFGAELSRAIVKAEAERLFAQGKFKPAEAAFRVAQKSEPNNARLAVNLASLQYFKRTPAKVKEAEAGWTRHAGTVPEATLNLGISALERGGDVRRAIGYFDQYASGGGPRSASAREWSERLRLLHGGAVVTQGGVQ